MAASGVSDTGTTHNALLISTLFDSEGQMFVLSSQHIHTLLSPWLPQLAEPTGKLESLLDVGAGDGCVTEKLSPFFKSITATEVSRPMVYRLRSRGFR